MEVERQQLWSAKLRHANSHELLRLVSQHLPEIEIGQLRQVLRNPYVTAEVIGELASSKRLMTTYPARSAIARHPRTPETVALRYVSSLFWRDLMEIGLDVRGRPAVRRVADRYLIQRLPRLAVGERSSLARRAGAPVIEHLLADPEPRVLSAVLGNSRLSERLVLRLAGSREASPRHLAVLAASVWAARYQVKCQLCGNPMAPFGPILEFLPDLRRADLQALLEDSELSSVVHRRVGEVLSGRRRTRSG